MRKVNILRIPVLIVASILLFGLPATYVHAAGVPRFDHIIVFIMENHSFSEISGNPDAPFLNGDKHSGWSSGVATNYHGGTHPSLPNYMALTGGDTFFTTNCHIDVTTGVCTTSAPSLVDNVEASGRTWRAYMEDTPSPCFVGDNIPVRFTLESPTYVEKHNPFIHYNLVRNNPSRCNNIVPLTQLDEDLDSLPNFVWVTPNMCHDMHDSCDAISSIQLGDEFLNQQVPEIQQSDSCQAPHTCLIIITFDEGDVALPAPEDNHVFTKFISNGPEVQDSGTLYNHYSLLHTIEESWNLGTLTANDASATPMLEMFS